VSAARPAAACSALLAALAVSLPALADAPSLFGFGARAAGVARAGVALDDPGAAARENPALAAEPGLRVSLGYGYGALGLTFDGAGAGVPHSSGVDLAAQYGVHVARAVDIGLALALHLPDPYLAQIAFQQATVPQFVLYGASLQRTSFDLAVAVRIGPVSIGGGAAAGLSVGGQGASFDLGQDAHGTNADGSVDVSIPYHLAPILGARADLGRVAIGASFRGPVALDLSFDNRAAIDLSGNPLNGTTTVAVSGTSGYDPAVVTLGAKVAVGGGVTLLGSLEYAAYHSAPPPVADVEIAVHLGTTPGLREVSFPSPRFRDTIAPRLGVELRRPSAEAWRWAARAGYAVLPSPVPTQTGFTTYTDATRHQLAIGGGYHIGRLAGVDLALDAAGQLHLLAPRTEDKDNPALPYAQFEVGGHILYGALTLEATW
jgi:long-subunit fatty acid transport protein